MCVKLNDVQFTVFYDKEKALYFLTFEKVESENALPFKLGKSLIYCLNLTLSFTFCHNKSKAQVM